VLLVFVVGMALTTLGAAVPAWIAAKMPPVEAMRGEK
jgi:ABC-type lipoprotein release transport system permease subunit